MKNYFRNIQKKHPKFPRISGFVSLCLALIIILSTSSQAVMAVGGKFDAKFYSANNIIYYNANENDCLVTATLKGGGNNKDYANNEILSKAQIQAELDNYRFYNEAANASDIPWPLLAAIHYRENGLKRASKDKNGPYQIKTGDYPVAASYSDEQFLDASKKAAAYIKSLAGGRDLDDPNNVKFVLYAFNGASVDYVTQAIALGFNEQQAANGEGSPYVMNRADAKRDASVLAKDEKTWGEKSNDGVLEYPANNQYGAYVIYASLAGIKIDSGECSNGGLVDGGMTLEQAKAFMKSYLDDPTALNYRAGAGLDGLPCAETELGDCTVFSNYFINKYSNARSAGGNGIQVVENLLAANPSIKGGSTPAAYAVFSKPINPASRYAYAGHTGIIFGVAGDKLIVGQASCGLGFAGIEAVEISVSEFNQYGPVQYAYLANDLKEQL